MIVVVVAIVGICCCWSSLTIVVVGEGRCCVGLVAVVHIVTLSVRLYGIFKINITKTDSYLTCVYGLEKRTGAFQDPWYTDKPCSCQILQIKQV